MSPRSLVVLCLSAGVLLCGAPAAQAACTSSTPSSASFADPANDMEGAAPDLKELKFSLDAGCRFTFDSGLASLTEEDAVAILIDRDGNPATGDPDLLGTDLIAVMTDTVTALGWWDGVFYRSDESLIEGSASPIGLSIAIDHLGIPPGTAAAFRVLSLGPGEEDVDGAPNTLEPITLAVNYEGVPEVPTFPPLPDEPDPQTPSPSPFPIAPPSAQTPSCTVPKLKGRTLAGAKSRLAASGCTAATNVTRRYSSIVRKGRVIGTAPRSGTRTTKRVKLIVSKGKRPKRANG